MPSTITTHEYKTFQDAYDFMNRELFGSSLPHVLITLQRHAKAKGYHKSNAFQNRLTNTSVSEVALNPDVFTDRSDELILSTLVHEMAHVWRHNNGKPPRAGYHDKQWAAKMKEIGLQPSDTGKPGGKEIGQGVTHYIIPGGKYEQAYGKLAAKGHKLNWQSQAPTPKQKKQTLSKTKYTCPLCGTNAWAKPSTLLICGECYDQDGGECTTMKPQ